VDKGTLYLFDTTVLLALIRGRDLGRYINHTFALADVMNKPLISIVSHGEIWAMAERNGWGDKKRQALSEMLSDLVTLDLNDRSIIEAYVEVDKKNLSHPKGARVLSDNDKWIAATARAASAVLLTTDQDFIHLNPDVCTVHYVDPGARLPASGAGTQQELP
jgi:predicted nucleic acid-binding protein